MLRKIIKIDEDKCVGCGLCTNACHEKAIELVNGKAKLIRDDYCDGLGNCLPVCPTGAISFEEREAKAYDKEEVKAHKARKKEQAPTGCPGTAAQVIQNNNSNSSSNISEKIPSQLRQWPIQIQLVPETAPYFENANLLVAADCTAFAYGNFHTDYIKNKITIIGCPKLDQVDYQEKLTAILKGNNIKSLTIIRMEVPCCGGLEDAVKNALRNSDKLIPWQVVTISINGEILDD